MKIPKLFESIEGPTLYTRTVAGTEWPGFKQIKRISARKYAITEICNGIAESYKEVVGFQTALAEARF